MTAPRITTNVVLAVNTAEPSLFERLSSGRALLTAGIALRFLVFLFLAPLNNDTGHLDVIKYVVEHHALPSVTAALQMSFQPPLYYLLAAPLYRATGSAKGVQFLSLGLSILTLLVLYHLLYEKDLMGCEKARLYAFLLACFLPQFVLFSLYVSNDTLTIFFGALMILQVARFVATPNDSQVALLGLLLGVGLLTKATFLVFVPVFFVLVLFVRFRKTVSPGRVALAALLFLVLSCGLGSYKFVRNYRELKNPFISDIDFNYRWKAQQQQSYRGAASFFDINLLNLLASPTVDPRKPPGTPLPATEGSYPLLLYGSFWYPLIQESNFAVSRPSFNYLGSVIYVFALLPTAVFFIGLFLLVKRFVPFLTGSEQLGNEAQRLLVSYASVFCLLGNLALLVVLVLKSHTWSWMSGRLLFPSLWGLLVPFGVGMGGVTRRKAAASALKFAMVALVTCFALYFAGEIIYKILYHSCFDAPYCG